LGGVATASEAIANASQAVANASQAIANASEAVANASQAVANASQASLATPPPTGAATTSLHELPSPRPRPSRLVPVLQGLDSGGRPTHVAQ
jgi:hypothetical protein